jgi:hypothetical protein
MTRKEMRRICASLIRGLDLSNPSDPAQMITALCRRLEERSGREVRHTLVPFPPHTVSGMWIATDTTDHILCETHTSPWHQLLITCHEAWHILEALRLGPGRTRGLAGELTVLDASALGRIMAARGPYDAVTEQDADLFASLLIARLTDGPPAPEPDTPPDASVDRVKRTLRNRQDGPS